MPHPDGAQDPPDLVEVEPDANADTFFSTV